ncbi:MAG: hypothetical protein LBQ42_07015, partial [Synergistaceae bacterium]|nr:hypothetical protein [Synergistaceae bacterium]
MYSRLIPERDLRRQVDPPDHRLMLKYVLDMNIAEMDAREDPVPNGARKKGFIDILSASVRELLLEGVAPDMLLPGTGESDEPGRYLLYRLYTGYLMYLEENGLADNSQVPWLLADALSSGDAHPLENAVMCWVGFLSFTGSQLRLVKTLRRFGQRMEFFVPVSGLAKFRGLSEQIEIPIDMIDGLGGAIIALKAGSVYDQYDGIAGEIASAFRGEGALCEAMRDITDHSGIEKSLSDIGILVARDRLQLLASALKKHGVPYQSRSETPVSETRLMDLAKRAWETYRLDWPARRTEYLLRTAGAAGISGEPSEAKMTDWPGNPERHRSSLPPDGIESWLEALTDFPDQLAFLKKINAFCEFLDEEGGHTAEELLRALLALCGEGWETNLAHEAADDYEMDFAVREMASSRLELEQKLEMLADMTPPLGAAGLLRFSGAEAIGFLTDWAAEAATALPQPIRGAVALYDSPPPVLVSHSLWIMTDVDPSGFPGASSDQPLLNAELRDRVNKNYGPDMPGESENLVHLPTMHEKREQKEALFRRLLSLGETAVIIARSERDSQGREQGDSPFVVSVLTDSSQGWSKSGDIFCEPSVLTCTETTNRGMFPRYGNISLNTERKL